MKYFISLLTAVFLMAGSFSTLATAETPAMQKLNLLHMEKVQTPYSRNPLAENIIKADYVTYDHHGRKKICRHRHCTHWKSTHDHHGNHRRVCTHYRYSQCRYPSHGHH